ncbi:MAG: ribosome small subunit-dependent GTPase A [Candidatus Moraniibacteriota bacterium]
MEEKIIKIEDLGYDDFFESNRAELGWDDFSVARVIAQYKGAYKVKNTEGEYLAKITGKQIFEATSKEDYPAVGDWVIITEDGGEQAIIHKVLPRKTVMKRKCNNRDETQIIATNIDTAFVIEAVDRDYNLNRIERYFAIARDSDIQPAIILNKIDLVSKEELDLKLAEIKNRMGDVEIISTSTLTKEGLMELEKHIVKRKTYCFLGSSGVGKSSLINKLLGEEIIKTEKIGERSERGRHTTTAREMYFLADGGIVIDNPGVREVGMTDTKVGINNLFEEITALAKNCKYTNCTHLHEPDCAVLAAVESGELNRGEHMNYVNLKKESEHYEMTEIQKKKKDRQFGKFFKNAKKEFRKIGHKDF